MVFSVSGNKASRWAVAFSLAAALLTPAFAYRSPILDWNENHSLFVLSPAAHDQHDTDYQQADSGLNRGLVASVLQIKSRSEKEMSEGEEKASGSEAAGTKAEESTEKEGSAEAGEEAEEEAEGSASAAEPEEGRKGEKKTEAESKVTSVKEAPSVKEGEKPDSEHASPTTEKGSAAPGESSALSATPSATVPHAAGEDAEAAPHAPAGHGGEVSAKVHADESLHEPTHTKENHEEAAKSSKISAEKAEQKKHAAGDTLVESKIPSPDKLVVQLNFRPSMVISRADADKVERHVITEKTGSSWYQVLGEKALTILKLTPVEGEKLLHTARVTEQST